LFKYTSRLFTDNSGGKLTSVGVHDLVCKIAEVVVVGGVRRAALISLSNLSDDRMRHAKAGSWWVDNPERALANNSIAYTEKPDIETYMREMTALIASKSGERGIFSRPSAQAQASRWGRRDGTLRYGINPCSEIILKSQQFCNLTEVVIRATDTFADVKRKVGLAAVIGTIQSTLTDFKYLSPEWKENTDAERLLGVSMTGIMDHPLFSNSAKSMPKEWWGNTVVPSGDSPQLPTALEILRDHAREVNKEWANMLGIPVSAAITCVKPSGTVSQLVDAASGIHARHNPFYIRRVRMDKKDPVYSFLKDKGVPVEDEARSPDTTAVFSFPMKAPDGAICRADKTAIEQLETWLIYQRHWCEHKPSVTISVKDCEWPEVIAWVWKYFDEVSGISFLPFSDHTYVQAPYEDINQEQYSSMLATMPTGINFSEMLEVRDNTEGSQTLACTAGGCEI
jgi:ribonucleoside-diphosphate reductase alpha chain